ncbi:hypothetical protein GLOIN_2v1773797 [Rhizophagus clarus]|uniref:Uncharacterized protein n=1 Tax=Rhizophagus clarus TaxID=94130 RepID=A0A8H3LFT2_9GLOM|nr:hypothetical protein GLOIN_2v1773797 [Rhizophagus clarus]
MDIIKITEAAEIDDAKVEKKEAEKNDSKVEKEVLETKKDNAEVEKDDDAKANREVKIQFNQADNQETSQMIFNFAIKTHEQMKQLGIVSLNIIQSLHEIILKTEHQIYNILPSNKIIAENTTNILTQNILLKKPHDLSKSSIKMALQFHQLLLNLDKLPVPVLMMNPSKFDKPDNYIQVLFRKLEKGVELDNDDFLYLPNQLDDDKSEDGDKNEDQPDDDKSEVVISEINLLRNENDLYFNFNKEKAIKILSRQIGKIYDKIKEEYIEVEIKRRRKFRFYVNILNIQRKIENYCCLYRTRNKGETIKSQSVNKIIQYNSNITHNNLKNILKTARRIESIIKVANDNWASLMHF